MATIEIHTLANSYAEGKISKEAFRSLYSALALENFPAFKEKKPSIVRRFFKQVYYYFLIAVVLTTAYFSILFFYPDLFSQTKTYSYLELPADIQKAARILSTTPDWHHKNIEEFMMKWNGLGTEKQRANTKSHWYKAFTLAAALQHTQQKMKLQDGKNEALESLKALDKLLADQQMFAKSDKPQAKKKT